jgi:hypothetical protein
MKGGVIKGNTAANGGGVAVYNNEDATTTFTMEGGTIYGSGEASDPNTATSGASLYVASGVSAKWGADVTTHEIGDTTSGSAGGNIISSGNAVDGTIHAVSP